MMHHRQSRPSRRPEQGTVVIIVAALFTMLFGMAALSIDVGSWYLGRRNLQSVADAAVVAGLPALGSSTSTAISNASSILTANGYGSVTPTTSAAANLRYLTVSITASQTSYFGKIFGVSAKSTTVTAQGQSTIATPAILALGSGCSVGVNFNGTGFDIYGDVDSNSQVTLGGAVNNNIHGSVEYNSSCAGGGYSNTGVSVSGGASSGGGSVPSPFSYTAASFTCPTTTVGALTLNWPVADGTYCATGNVSFNASGITGVNAHITIVSGGQVTFSAATLKTINANENGIIAYSSYATPDCNLQAINIGSGNVIMNGSFYAPNGCINASGNTMTYNGSIIGKMVQMGIGNSSTVTGVGGGSATYSLYQ
jgi:Flp pilus assembly protein TadG